MKVRRIAAPPVVGAGLLATLTTIVLLIWFSTGVDAALWRALGIGQVASGTLPRTVYVTITPHDTSFNPPAAALFTGGRVTFVNRLSRLIVVRATAAAPVRFSLIIRPHAQATVTLTHPGLYHYYESRSAHPLPPTEDSEYSRPSAEDSEYSDPTPYTDPSDVIVGDRASSLPREGWIDVLSTVPTLKQTLLIPNGHALFVPKVVVTLAGGTVMVANHDAEPHNFVVDPSSPTGAAFMIDGARDVPTQGAQRALVLQQPGLYHVYCTLHAEVVDMMGGWHRVMQRPHMREWVDVDNPMEAWIIVLPATVGSP